MKMSSKTSAAMVSTTTNNVVGSINNKLSSSSSSMLNDKICGLLPSPSSLQPNEDSFIPGLDSSSAKQKKMIKSVTNRSGNTNTNKNRFSNSISSFRTNKKVNLVRVVIEDKEQESKSQMIKFVHESNDHQQQDAPLSINTSKTSYPIKQQSTSKCLKIIDFKLISHKLQDLGLDSWSVKKIWSLVTNNYLDKQDLIFEATLNKLQKLFNEHQLHEFFDYLENDDTISSIFKSSKSNAQLMKNKNNPNDTHATTANNKLMFWINKWEKNRELQIANNQQGSENLFMSAISNSSNYDNDSFINNHHSNSIRIVNFITPNAVQHRPGPNLAKLMEILEKNDYILELSNGQRKYGKPSVHSQTEPLPNNTEIFVGKIPKDLFEDELVPLFESIGPIYNLRLMMDPLTGLSRGYAFITYFQPEHARSAVEKFDNYELPNYGIHLKVKMSIPNVRLFIGNISKEMTKEDIRYEFQKQTVGLVDVIVYHLPHDRKRNRGFCFLEYESHKLASQAKRKLMLHRTKIWDSDIWVDWAEPLEQPNEEVMSQVKVLCVRNLSLEMTDHYIKELFEKFGTIERVKKIKDYAFVHFEERQCALKAMEQMNGYIIMPEGLELEISLAKPPTDKKRKKEILRNREKRLMNMMMHTRFTSVFDNNNAATISICNNHPAIQTITFAPQSVPTLPGTACFDSSTMMMAPILLNSGTTIPTESGVSTTYNIPITPIMATSANLSATTYIPNFFVGYSPSHHHHYPIYQLPSMSAVARVTLASPVYEEIYSHNDHDHNQITNGSIKSQECIKALLESDLVTGCESNDHSINSEFFDLYNRNYCFYENCTWYGGDETISSALSSQQSNIFAIIPARDQLHHHCNNKINHDISQNTKTSDFNTHHSSSITSSLPSSDTADLTTGNSPTKATNETLKSNHKHLSTNRIVK